MSQFKKIACVLCGITFFTNVAMQTKYAIGSIISTSAGAYETNAIIKLQDIILIKCDKGFQVGRIDGFHGSFYEVTTIVPLCNEGHRGGKLFKAKDLYKLPEQK